MAQATPIILTKILVPKRRSAVFHRPRLVNFIHDHIERKLILISAAPGYGKTSLLIDFAHNTDLPVCWYALDEGDRDLSTLCEYLVATIRRRYPGFGQRSQALLRGMPISGADIQVLASTLVNEIQETIPEYFVLILDNYDLLDDSRSVEAFFDLLLRYLPENCHIIIASRAVPDLPLLRLAAYQEVAGLSGADLSFTVEEIQSLLQKQYNLTLSDDEARELVRESEGWITGLLLSAQTVWRGRPEILGLTWGSHEQVFNYLAREVFAQQPPEVQRFLLQSSILQQINPALCDELLGIDNSRQLIDWVEEHNLFVTRTEERETWYRYSRLVEEFLRARLHEKSEADFESLHTRAARLFEARGQLDQAIYHWLQIESYAQACGLINRVAPGMFEAGRLETLDTWINALPDDVLAQAPDLLITRARIHMVRSELLLARRALQRANDAFTATYDLAGQARALVYQGMLAALEGSYQDAVERCERALESLSPQERWLNAAARRNLGVGLWGMGDLDRARRELQRALTLYEGLGNVYHVANVHQELGNCLRALGDMGGADQHYRKALALWDQIGNPAALANVLNSMAVSLYHRGEYDQALKLFDRALANAREAAHRRFEGYVLAGMGDVRRDLGDYDACRELYEDALSLANQVGDGMLTVYALDALGNTFRLRGDHATATGFIRQACEEATRHQSGRELGLCETSQGILLCEGGDLPAALEHLQRARALFEQARARLDLAKVYFYLAQALYLAKNWSEALDSLGAALDLSYEIGVDQFMVVNGVRALSLLRYAARRMDDPRVTMLLGRVEEFRKTIAARSGALASTPAGELPSVSLEVRAFGTGTVYRDAALITPSDWGAAQARELFFYLLSYPHRTKDQIGLVFWPDLPPARMTSTFHATLYRLRRAAGRDCILYEGDRYSFNRQINYWYDVEQFETLIGNAITQHNADADAAARSYRQAIELYGGDFLEDIYSDWAASEQEALRQRFLDAATRLAAYYVEHNEHGQAIQLYRSVLERDEFREDVHRALMETYAQAGQRARALQHFEHLTRLLTSELGAPPASETVALYEQIRRGE
jgi:LuxR family maltose regulon positive regulatory protein